MKYTEEQLKEIDNQLEVISELGTLSIEHSDIILGTAVSVFVMSVIGFPTLENDNFDEEFAEQIANIVKEKFSRIIASVLANIRIPNEDVN